MRRKQRPPAIIRLVTSSTMKLCAAFSRKILLAWVHRHLVDFAILLFLGCLQPQIEELKDQAPILLAVNVNVQSKI
jgi:hypothetical protein